MRRIVWVGFVNVVHEDSIFETPLESRSLLLQIRRQADGLQSGTSKLADAKLIVDMKLFLKLSAIVIILASCTIPPSSPTSTFIPQASPTFTVTPVPESIPQATATTIPCDPLLEDFCIIEGHFILQRPIKPPGNNIVDRTYPYGSTVRSTREPHHGVEFLNQFGTPVHAAADGVVTFAGVDAKAIYSPWENFYGNVVVIRHDNDLFTLYAHLSEIDVQAGKGIQVGEKIGEVGQSGVATGSHLHFEVRRGDEEDYFSTQNPELWLAPNKDINGDAFGALAVSIIDQESRFRYAEFTIKYYLNRSQSHVKSHYVITYSPDMANGDENAALSDLPSGSYRIALKMNGQLYERWVEVESGKLTEVVFITK